MNSRKLFLVLLVAFVALLVAFAPVPLPQLKPVERNFQVAASSYAFSPAEIRVNPGDRVTIALTSTDVVHGLYIDGYDLTLQCEKYILPDMDTSNQSYPLLLEKVAKGELGAKTGKGFYDWTSEFSEAWRKKILKSGGHGQIR